MVTTVQKRVVTGVFAGALLVSSLPATADVKDTLCKVGIGAAAIAGIAGIGAAIAYAFSEKSDEQLVSEARDEVSASRIERRQYYDLYEVWIGLRYLVDPKLDALEQQFLYPVALHAWTLHNSVDAHISAMNIHFSTLKKLLDTILERINRLECNGNSYLSIYDRLVSARRDLREELAQLDGYYQLMAQHKGFFSLYAYEAMLYDVYNRELEIGRNYQYDPYLFERYLIQAVYMHGLPGEYPVLTYLIRLNDHLEALAQRIDNLKYYYPSRTVLAQQLYDYLLYVRGVVEVSVAYREEKQLKRVQEEQEIRRRELIAREVEANARTMQASAEWALAREERERNRIEREKLRQQQETPVIIISNY